MADETPDWAKDESERAQPAPVGGPYSPVKRMNPHVRLFWVIFWAILAAQTVICLGAFLLAHVLYGLQVQ